VGVKPLPKKDTLRFFFGPAKTPGLLEAGKDFFSSRPAFRRRLCELPAFSTGKAGSFSQPHRYSHGALRANFAQVQEFVRAARYWVYVQGHVKRVRAA
jgi:hypothetical protein